MNDPATLTTWKGGNYQFLPHLLLLIITKVPGPPPSIPIKGSSPRSMPVEPDPSTVYTSRWLDDQSISTNMSFRGKGYVLGQEKEKRKDSVVLPSWIESTFPWRVPGPESSGEGQRMVSLRPLRNTHMPRILACPAPAFTRHALHSYSGSTPNLTPPSFPLASLVQHDCHQHSSPIS